MHTTYFSVGPTQLYPHVPSYYQDGFELGYGSIHHRSAIFEDIYSHTESQLRKLLSIPLSHAILFLPSPTEIFERVLDNLVLKKSVHLVNGSFSSRWYNYAQELKIDAISYEKKHGDGFTDVNEFHYCDQTELICATQNETSAGTQIPLSLLYNLKSKFPNALLCVDAVTSIPHVELDYSMVDCAFFAVQKGMGLPPGLSVLILNEHCMAKNLEVLKMKAVHPHHRLDRLMTNYNKKQTTSTPNTLGIYVLGRVAEAMNIYSLEQIKADTTKKATLLYSYLDQSSKFRPLVHNKDLRSETTISVKVQHSEELLTALKQRNLILSSGYGDYKNSEIRIANFPAITMSDMEYLLSVFRELE
jgi:phosphoserine aminotransferase